ncbi:MAG: hypothetical protein VW551_00490 [Euryarchaeota archaeon]|jgi:hypothetical protein
MSEQQTQTAPEAEAQQSPDLTIQDLTAMKSVIDVASQRGAFKPNEMTTVGTLYTKLEAFLNAVAEQQAAAAEAQGEGAPQGE